MTWWLIVLILANNAEAVDQVGPFASRSKCQIVAGAIEARARRGDGIVVLGCFER